MKGSNYIKRTQKDYSLSLKLQIVQEIERGELSTHGALRKYGIQARSTVVGWLRKHGKFNRREFLWALPRGKGKSLKNGRFFKGLCKSYF